MKTCDRSNGVMTVMVLYLCTLFIYKDFGVRMILGYAVLGAALILLAVKYGELRVSRDAPAFLLIAAAVLLAYLRPTARFDKDTIAYAVAMCMSVCCVMLARTSGREYRRVEKIVFIFAAAFAVIVLISRLNRDFYLNTFYPLLTEEAQEEAHFDLWHGYSCPIGGDATFHNYMFMLAALFCVGRVAAQPRRWGIYLPVSLLFVAASFLTGRRGEFLVLLIVWAAVGFLVMGRRQRRSAILVAVVLILAVLPLVPRLLNSSLLSRYQYTLRTYQEGADFLGGRLDLWREALRLFRENPLVGIGWGGYGNYVTEAFREAHGNVYNVHNIYLQFLAETGLIGTVLILSGFFGLLFLTIHRLCRVQKMQTEIRDAKQYLAVSLGIQSYFILMGFMDPCFMKYYFWVIYAIAFLLQQHAMELCWAAQEGRAPQEPGQSKKSNMMVGE